MLWSPPFEGLGEHSNYKRGGAGVEFGKDVSVKICERLGEESNKKPRTAKKP